MHFSALRFKNNVPVVRQILHVMSILIPVDVPRVSRSKDYFLIPKEITSGTPLVDLCSKGLSETQTGYHGKAKKKIPVFLVTCQKKSG